MMITPAMVGPVRTGLINVLGFDYPIRAMISIPEPAIVAGVVEAGSDRFLPFTVGPAHDVVVWTDNSANRVTDAVFTVLDILSDIRYGSRKNPHP